VVVVHFGSLHELVVSLLVVLDPVVFHVMSFKFKLLGISLNALNILTELSRAGV